MSTQTDAFADGIMALTEALRSSAADPSDQIRLMISLAGFAPAVPTGTAAIGAAMATATNCTAALCRRAALISLANACAGYQPTSYDDAEQLKRQVRRLFDAEATIAADAGDCATYQMLAELGAAVAQDLDTRGAQLPELVTITIAVPIPAPVLAYRLYGDATRADDLTARADPPHPAFMPTEFRALSS
jgi:prophage DNA circulation protein